MCRNPLNKYIRPKSGFWVIIGFLMTQLISCGLSPQQVDLDLNNTLPEVKVTVFSEAIRKLGQANQIFGRGALYIMSKPAFDRTGTSLPTQGEIPQDISEMVKSTLNAVGGNIWYVPYDPEFMLNTAQTGYSEWGDKLLPDVVLVGGLTEFDRGLVTKEEGADVSGSAEELGVPMGLDFQDTRKTSLARITLDFNLLDFKTFTGIPFVQAVNSIQVHKGLGIDQLGFTVYGQTLGLRGNIKKIQGRHAAVRLLVQLSIIQIIGKYQKLPYWRLIPNMSPDPVVLDALREEFYAMDRPDRIAKIQEYLYLLGKPVKVTGRLDTATMQAIASFKSERGLRNPSPISEELYLALIENVPIDIQAKVRRRQVNVMIEDYRQNLKTLALQEVPPVEPSVTADVSDSPARETVVERKEKLVPELGELKVWTDKSEVRIGEEIAILFQVSRPMFVRIVVVNAAGQMTTLFPNPYQNDNHAMPGKVYRIPPVGSPIKLTAGAPAGVDKIRAVASFEPVTAEDLQLTESGDFSSDISGNGKRVFAGAEYQVTSSSQQKVAVQ